MAIVYDGLQLLEYGTPRQPREKRPAPQQPAHEPVMHVWMPSVMPCANVLRHYPVRQLSAGEHRVASNGCAGVPPIAPSPHEVHRHGGAHSVPHTRHHDEHPQPSERKVPRRSGVVRVSHDHKVAGQRSAEGPPSRHKRRRLHPSAESAARLPPRNQRTARPVSTSAVRGGQSHRSAHSPLPLLFPSSPPHPHALYICPSTTTPHFSARLSPPQATTWS